MKKLLLFMFAIVAFAACEQAPIEEQSAIRPDVPDTITVGFEGDETRIKLNEAQKTVWTKGDLVSVFYRSNANQQWKYDGETGSRTANLKRVDAGTATRDMDRVVVVYPYNEDYYINPSTFNVQASLSATQHYLANSYGLDGNIMISSAEYNDVTLKNVCGWLKLQLTGDGEVVKSITFKGNNGEQVAGELYINSADATAILASDMGNIAEDDGNNATGGAGANLSFDDVVLKEVTLNCGEGVTLGAEATAFYIALPPQTFEEGFTVEVKCIGYKTMTISTDNSISLERNHIQPMAALEFINTNPPTQPTPASNEIWYTSSDGDVVTPYKTDVFGATIISNEYNDGKGVITFDGDVTSIGDYAFKDCSSLTSVNIPDSVTTIGIYAFYSCTSLTSVNIPDSITTIGYYAFAYCESLTSVNIPDSVTTIEWRAFYGCSSLTSVNIPDSVTSIENQAFEYCDSLTSVNIPNSVTTIGDYAFRYCTSLKKVYCYATIPPSLGGSAFSSNASARRIYVYEECVEVYKSAWSSYKDSIYTNGQNYPYTTTTTIQYTTNDGNTITSSKLPIISNIYENGVGTLVVVGKIALIPNSAFYGCASLTSITIPDSVTAIGAWAFDSCTSLTSVNIPDSVTKIGDYAFQDCTSLTSVNIPDSVTTIGNSAFYGCTSLTSVTIPDSVTSIGNGAFSNCTSLTSVTIPDSVTTIENEAFSSCSSLTSVTIPDSVTTIGASAFAYCDSLTSVNIPDSVTTIGNQAFRNCSLTSVTIPDSVTTIGNEAFTSCTSLTSVNIGDSVTTIGSQAFSYCYSLTSVTIGDSVTSIGEKAFYYSRNLTSVYCKATTPPALVNTSVFDYNGSGRKIYVPAGSVEAYKSATRWSEYASAIVGYDF